MKHTKFLWVRPSTTEALARLLDFSGVLLPRRVRVRREDALVLAWQTVGDCLRQSLVAGENSNANG